MGDIPAQSAALWLPYTPPLTALTPPAAGVNLICIWIYLVAFVLR